MSVFPGCGLETTMAYPIRPVPLEQLPSFLTPIFTALGIPITPDTLERLRGLSEFDVRLGAYDEEKLVGAAGRRAHPGRRPVPRGASAVVPRTVLTLRGWAYHRVRLRRLRATLDEPRTRLRRELPNRKSMEQGRQLVDVGGLGQLLLETGVP